MERPWSSTWARVTTSSWKTQTSWSRIPKSRLTQTSHPLRTPSPWATLKTTQAPSPNNWQSNYNRTNVVLAKSREALCRDSMLRITRAALWVTFQSTQNRKCSAEWAVRTTPPIFHLIRASSASSRASTRPKFARSASECPVGCHSPVRTTRWASLRTHPHTTCQIVTVTLVRAAVTPTRQTMQISSTNRDSWATHRTWLPRGTPRISNKE